MPADDEGSDEQDNGTKGAQLAHRQGRSVLRESRLRCRVSTSGTRWEGSDQLDGREIERRAAWHPARQRDQRDVATVVYIAPSLGSVSVAAAPDARNSKLYCGMTIRGNTEHNAAARNNAHGQLEEQCELLHQTACHGHSLRSRVKHHPENEHVALGTPAGVVPDTKGESQQLVPRGQLRAGRTQPG